MPVLALLAVLQSDSVPRKMQPPSAQMRTAIERAVGDKLMDGSSAKYRWPDENRNGVGYCGFVNGKNSYGAYVGFRPFYVLGAHADGENGHGQFNVMQAMVSGSSDEADTDIVNQMCARIGSDISTLPPESASPPVSAGARVRRR